jgi:intein N-terminal splicing region|nr:MAG TPA: Hint [Caudoviricetes sp.]
MAEGITTSGQLASRYIERKVVELLNKMLGKDKPAEEWVVAGDTDSVDGDSVIVVNGQSITIAEFFQQYQDSLIDGDGKTEFVCQVNDGSRALAFDTKANHPASAPISYVMRHKVKKRMYRITSNGQSVIVTADHSLIVLRGEQYIDCTPSQLQAGDKIVQIGG